MPEIEIKETKHVRFSGRLCGLARQDKGCDYEGWDENEGCPMCMRYRIPEAENAHPQMEVVESGRAIRCDECRKEFSR